MADVLPVFSPGEDVTYTASATITGRQLVESTGDMTVGPAGAASTKVVGVAVQDAASGARVGVSSDGVWELTASGTVTAGDDVVAAAAGAVATIAAVTTPTPGDVTNTRAIVGRCIQGATNGNLARVQLLLG